MTIVINHMPCHLLIKLNSIRNIVLPFAQNLVASLHSSASEIAGSQSGGRPQVFAAFAFGSRSPHSKSWQWSCQGSSSSAPWLCQSLWLFRLRSIRFPSHLHSLGSPLYQTTSWGFWGSPAARCWSWRHSGRPVCPHRGSPHAPSNPCLLSPWKVFRVNKTSLLAATVGYSLQPSLQAEKVEWPWDEGLLLTGQTKRRHQIVFASWGIFSSMCMCECQKLTLNRRKTTV